MKRSMVFLAFNILQLIVFICWTIVFVMTWIFHGHGISWTWWIGFVLLPVLGASTTIENISLRWRDRAE